MNTRPERREFRLYRKHRPQGDSLRAKAARAEQNALARPTPSLPRVLFLELAGPELWAALAKRGRA